MAHRSVQPARITITGDRELGRRLVPYARTLLGTVIEDRERLRLGTHTASRRIGDAVVTAAFDGLMATLTIDVRTTGTSERRITVVRAAVWVPRGFVLYPVSDSSPMGWGVPVIPVTDDDIGPYDIANLAPGLDTTRWTPGGPLGQVLLTRQPDAGYPPRGPTILTAPLYFHPTKGIRPTEPIPAEQGAWTAYRIEFEDYSSQSPSDPGSIVSRNWKRESRDLVNAHRVSLGRSPLLPPIRGHYDSAQATTECMAAAQIVGHYSADFPATYEAAPDRLTKDGCQGTLLNPLITAAAYDDRNVGLGGGENLLGSPGAPLTVVGIDPNGVNIYHMAPGPPFTATEAFDLWMSSTPHRENIENTFYDTGNYVQNATSLRMGRTGAYYGQHFVYLDQWVAAGNATWTSAHAEIPQISWFSFNSMNLAWETWPIDLTFDDLTGTATLELRFVAGYGITQPIPELAGGYLSWITYTEHADPSRDSRTRPGLGRLLFCRGRAFAIAPRGGLILSAAFQKLPAGSGAQQYRLVVLVHHREDESATPLVDGMTSVLRVWYIDIAAAEGLEQTVLASPETIIRGVYGEEDAEAWPWIHLNSPYSWRGGTAVDVSDGSTLLKYTSLWRFDSTGTHAVCLRDYGTAADYEDEYATGAGATPGFGSFEPAPFGVFPGGQLGVFTGGRRCKYLELDLTDAAAPSLAISAVNAGGPAQTVTETYSALNSDSATAAAWLRPMAVDYDSNDDLVFAFHVVVSYPGAYGNHLSGAGDIINNERYGVYFGAWDVTYSICATSTTWHSTLMALPGEDLMTLPASIVSVRDKVFAVCGTAPPATDTGPSVFSTPADADYPLWVTPAADAAYRGLDFTADCLACTQVPASHTVRMYRQGTMILEHAVPNTDALVHDRRLFPNCDHRWMVLTVNPALTATYVTDRAGEWVATIDYLPQAAFTYRFAEPEDPPVSPPTCYARPDNGCYNNCGWAWDVGSTLFLTGFSHAADGGGAMTSSLGDAAALADLMGIPGADPRALYARVV